MNEDTSKIISVLNNLDNSVANGELSRWAGWDIPFTTKSIQSFIELVIDSGTRIIYKDGVAHTIEWDVVFSGIDLHEVDWAIVSHKVNEYGADD